MEEVKWLRPSSFATRQKMRSPQITIISIYLRKKNVDKDSLEIGKVLSFFECEVLSHLGRVKLLPIIIGV